MVVVKVEKKSKSRLFEPNKNKNKNKAACERCSLSTKIDKSCLRGDGDRLTQNTARIL
jgi:hypothetical protein